MGKERAKSLGAGLVKTPTGIQGLDEITGGGLPKGRPTLVCGAGCGKTLFGMEFLVRGAIQYERKKIGQMRKADKESEKGAS